MISDYIRKIKANVSIYASKKTNSVLDGTYTSVFMGRSMNFEDLREYVPGDSIRDIDWKASSRSGNLLVKRYVAEKKHNIMLVMDTGVKMLGETKAGRDKKEIALYTAGTISYLAYKNGDNIGCAYNKAGKIQYHQFRTGLSNVEKFLTYYSRDMFEGKDNSLDKTMQFLASSLNRKMIIFVITDLYGMHSISESVIKQLKCRHDILFVNIDDADFTQVEPKKTLKTLFVRKKLTKQEKKKKKKGVYDLLGGHYVPKFISGDRKLSRLEQEYNAKLASETNTILNKYGISKTTIGKEDDILIKIVELLENHKNVNIR